MSYKLKPVTRLSIIFILAIVLSGSILTYFSINNISNLKELIEKKIIEEQRELSARFSTALQYKIDTLTAGLGNEDDQPGLIKDSLVNRAGEFDFIIQPFILTNNGQFVYPNFEGIPERVIVQSFTERFNTSFQEGEKTEFAKKDYPEAKQHYLSCLKYSTGNSDSAKALNALGRIALKLNDDENASARYSSIVLT